MTTKQKGKIVVDMAMTVLLFLLMAYQITGQFAHEWLGAGMFVLFLLHHVLNATWLKNLTHGRHTPVRALMTALDLLLFAAMLWLMVSGIILSRYVFSFLPISGGIAFARLLHLSASYWSFVLMSLHIGLHWGMVCGMIGRAAHRTLSRPQRVLLRGGAIALAAYGVCAFLRHDIASYLFLRAEFVFFNYDQPIPSFFFDYLAMMGLFVLLSYYAAKWLQPRKQVQP